MEMHEVIRRPLMTEKTTEMSDKNIFVFEVDKRATKVDVRKAIEKFFQVKVDSVNTAVCRGKNRRNRYMSNRLAYTRVKYWKKAIVRLKPGEKIGLFEGA